MFKFNKFYNLINKKSIFKFNFNKFSSKYCTQNDATQIIKKSPIKTAFKYFVQFAAFSTILSSSIIYANKNSSVFIAKSKDTEKDINNEYQFNISKAINLAIASMIAKNFLGMQSTQYFAKKIDEINPSFFLGDYIRALDLRDQSNKDPSKMKDALKYYKRAQKKKRKHRIFEMGHRR
eukprot:TRINITY_DN7385_c0_g1_i1.p1 TRINITY_DN7385_c0_g1~~TRINITY_DN7385_c0_g1_i1.p1  ORF type:complete len:178 (+),score=35.76 TRINITY_DN7385_c0_g1_i1:86-619(+)